MELRINHERVRRSCAVGRAWPASKNTFRLFTTIPSPPEAKKDFFACSANLKHCNVNHSRVIFLYLIYNYPIIFMPLYMIFEKKKKKFNGRCLNRREKWKQYLTILPDMNLSWTKIDQFKSLAAHVSQLFQQCGLFWCKRLWLLQIYNYGLSSSKQNYFDNSQRKVQK